MIEESENGRSYTGRPKEQNNKRMFPGVSNRSGHTQRLNVWQNICIPNEQRGGGSVTVRCLWTRMTSLRKPWIKRFGDKHQAMCLWVKAVGTNGACSIYQLKVKKDEASVLRQRQPDRDMPVRDSPHSWSEWIRHGQERRSNNTQIRCMRLTLNNQGRCLVTEMQENVSNTPKIKMFTS